MIVAYALLYPLVQKMRSALESPPEVCAICGFTNGLDRHHVTPRRMGGSKVPAVHDESNLMTLCRTCHSNIHDERWELIKDADGLQVVDKGTGEVIVRRLNNPGIDIPSLFQAMNLADHSLSNLHLSLPFLSDDQLVEAYGYATGSGKRSWMIQAAVLHEAQRRSVHGENTLEAIARRFEIGLRQAQKYALVWKVFFAKDMDGKNVNIDVFSLAEPSWYVIAATETNDPELWLGYAQDRKAEDPRYSVSAFRRDILVARFAQGVREVEEAKESWIVPGGNRWQCPWIKLLCTRSGKPEPYRACLGCEFGCEEESPSGEIAVGAQL